MNKILESADFSKPITTYLQSHCFNMPTGPSLQRLDKSAFGCVSQKVVTRFSHHTKTTLKYREFLKSIGLLTQNLNYSYSEDKWKQFYIFPQIAKIGEYALEGNVSVDKIVNINEVSVSNFADELIEHLRIGSNDVNYVKFLTGTIGVGKTTFLKYFSKTQKNHFLKNNVILSRIKFLDIEAGIKSNKSNNQFTELDVFLDEILGCLVRDFCDSLDRCRDKDVFPNQTKLAKLLKATDDVLEVLASKENQNINDILVELAANKSYLRRIPREDRIRLIEFAKNAGFRFCIILDGFDAMNPEEIQLFGNKSSVTFFDCLSSIIKNELSVNSDLGELITSLDKLFLVAVRPLTVTQLENDVTIDTDFHHLFDSEHAHVVGTDVYGAVKARLKVYFSINKHSSKQSDEFIDRIIEITKIVMTRLYQEHEKIEPGRFLSLFNHNVRDKFTFLKAVQNLILYKIELYHSSLQDKILDEKDKRKMDLKDLYGYIENNATEISINIYEIQRLLILNKDGYYKNYFRKDTERQPLKAESNRGQFDNIFNYHVRKTFSNEGDKYAFSQDPFLGKWLILQFLKKTNDTQIQLKEELEDVYQVLGVQVIGLEDWFKDNFHFTRLDMQNLRILIRSGLIAADMNEGTIFLKITTKGKFVIEELFNTNIYLEHVALNCIVPTFISDVIRPPNDSINRIWGRLSISNVCVLISYSRQVLVESMNDHDEDFKNYLLSIIRDNSSLNIARAFSGIITEGIINQPENYRDYATDLKIELEAIGVNFDF